MKQNIYISVFLSLLIIWISLASCDDKSENILAGTKWQSIEDQSLMVFGSNKVTGYRKILSGCYASYTSCYSVSRNNLTVDLLCQGEEIKRSQFHISNDTLYTVIIDDGDTDNEEYAYIMYEFKESELDLCK